MELGPSASKVDQVLAMLPPDEANALAKHLHHGTSARWISGVLRRHGINIAKTTINDWRKCNCAHGEANTA